MAIRHSVPWSFVVMGLLVAAATILVVELGPLRSASTIPAPSCPSLPGGTGHVYCENVSVPQTSSGQPCAVGATASGVFHTVTFAFQRYLGCGPLITYGINGTVEESGGSPQHFDLDVGPPGLILWCNYTSPDGLVLVAWLGLHQNVTLAVAT